MAKQKKGGSCLGLFIKSYFLIFVILAGITAVGALVSIHFFGVDQALWVDLSVWNTYPLIATYVVVLLSGFSALGVALLGAMVSAFFSKSEKSGGSPAARKKTARPQSNRKTTL